MTTNAEEQRKKSLCFMNTNDEGYAVMAPSFQGETMHTSSIHTILLDSQQEKKRFRKEHYNTVYAYAFDATGSDDQARELTEVTFADLEHRHENQPIAKHCDAYLAAQVYLLYAKGDFAAPSEKKSMVSEISAKEMKNGDPAGKTPTTVQTANEFNDDSHNQHESDEQDHALDDQAYTAVDAASLIEASVTDQVASSTQINSASECSGGVLASVNAMQSSAVYDEASTIFWILGQDQRRDQVDTVQPAMLIAEKPPERSAFLSVLNGVLILCSLAAIAFLIMQLDILPTVF